MVPNVSLAGIMKEILAILRMIPAENRISDINSGSGTQLDVQSTVIEESFIKSYIVAVWQRTLKKLRTLKIFFKVR